MQIIRTLGVGAMLFSFSSIGYTATCAQAENSATEPSGGFLRTLYDVDFELPTHAAGTWPVEGLGPSEVGFYNYIATLVPEAHKGMPEVVAHPLLDSQSAELNARPVNTNQLSYDDLYFQLGRAADYYTIAFDMVVEEHVDLTRTLLTIGDMTGTNCNAIFDANNKLTLVSQLADYAYDTRYHVEMTLMLNGDETGRLFFSIRDANAELYSGQFILTANGNDFGKLHLRGMGYEDPDNNYAQVDNVLIRAGYTSLPSLPDTDIDNDYILDFNSADSIAPSATFWVEDGFGLLFGSPNNDVYSADDSVAMRFSSSTRPTLVHQLGLPFTLKQLELGEYSTVLSSARTTTFTGHKYDGTQVTLDYTTDGVLDGTGGLNDMETVTFDETWSNLKAVQFTPTFSMDNVQLSVDMDTDTDDVHDWLDACLPEQSAAAAVENAVDRTEGCPLKQQGIETSDNGSSGGAFWTLPLLLMAGRRRQRNRD